MKNQARDFFYFSIFCTFTYILISIHAEQKQVNVSQQIKSLVSSVIKTAIDVFKFEDQTYFTEFNFSKLKPSVNDTISQALDFIPRATLINGAKEMLMHKEIFMGTARDNSKEIKPVLKYISMTGSMFRDYRVIIIENDSKDGTLELLMNWKLEHPGKVQIINKTFNLQKRPSLRFLSSIRNLYLFEAKNNSAYNDFDVFIVVDMDMTYGWDLRGVLHSFSKYDEWDVVSANGIFNQHFWMYDLLAFRVNKTTTNETFHRPNKEDIKNGKFNMGGYFSYLFNTHGKIVYKPSNTSDYLVPVDSAFGGMAFYKRKITKDCYYDSELEDCDHPTLHDCIQTRNGGKIFLNPAMLIKYRHYET